jgi:site-specific DNA recombinase
VDAEKKIGGFVEKQKIVGIWIRVSTEDQAKGESPEHHEKRARYYAESKGWTVKEVYHLEAVSGKSVMEHPETQRMLKDIKAGHITGIIFSKLARLARNTKELLEFAEIFRSCNADLISLQESIDTSSAAGRLFYTMIAAMAQWEREEIADRVAASVPIRAKLGKPLGGAAPYGYQWVDKKLVPDLKEVPVRKLMYDLFVEHRRMRTVARLLNQAGHRTRNGSLFSGNTVERLIRDPIAKGWRRANYTKSLGEGKNWVVKPQSEWVFTEVEPIVSEEMWVKCNGILEDQAKQRKRPARPTVHLFSGIVRCHCGAIMYVPSNSPKYICRKCRNKIGVEDLEEVFREQLKTFLFSDEEIEGYFKNADKLIQEKDGLVRTLTDEAEKIRREMDRLVRMCMNNELPEEGFGRHYKPLEERLKQVEAELPQIQGGLDFLKIQYLSSDEILSEAKDLYSRWPNLTHAEKRSIVETITNQVIIGPDEVTIRLNYLPSGSLQNGVNSATQPQGFIAQTNIKFAGYSTVIFERLMVTLLSSRG